MVCSLRSPFVSSCVVASLLASCGDAPRQGSGVSTSGASATAVAASHFELDRAIRPGTDIALSLDGKRVRDAAIVTHALDAMKAAPETAKKLGEIETKCKLSLMGAWEELRFSAKRSLGEGITYIRLNIPADTIATCFRTLWTDVKATDIAGHAAWIIPGEGAGAKPLLLVTEGNTLVLGTDGFVRDAVTGSPPDDVAALALTRKEGELGRGLVSFDEGALTKVAFRITATGDHFEMVAEPDLEDELAATAFITLLDETWADANRSLAKGEGGANGARAEPPNTAVAKPHVERTGKKIVITARVEGDATKQSQYLSGLSSLGFSAFQRFVESRKGSRP